MFVSTLRGIRFKEKIDVEKYVVSAGALTGYGEHSFSKGQIRPDL